MDISGSVALVTGANRGIGRQFALQLLDAGAARVYATARRPEEIDVPGVVALPLDITDPASVAAAAAAAPDVTLVVNNAGVAAHQDLVSGDLEQIRLEMETQFFGTLNVVRAFAPILGANGGGALLNVLSVLAFVPSLGASSYSAAKAAEWSLTNGVRLELAGQRTLVTGVHVGATETDMMARYDIPKLDPADVVAAALRGLESDALEVLVDEASVAAKAALARDPALVYPTAVPASWS